MILWGPPGCGKTTLALLLAKYADAEFKAAWQDAVNDVLTTGAEPAEALTDAERIAQDALDSAWAGLDEGRG